MKICRNENKRCEQIVTIEKTKKKKKRKNGEIRKDEGSYLRWIVTWVVT